MISNKLAAAFTFLLVTQAFALEGSAQVQIMENIGVGNVSFEGEAAANLYRSLKSPVIVITTTLSEKVGQSIGCSEELRAEQRIYRCGLIFDTETAFAEPERTTERR